MRVKGLPRLRILTALLGALVIVAVVPLVLSQLALIKISREALETAEKKTRIAVTLAEDVSKYVRTTETQLRGLAEGLKLAGAMSPDKDPFLFAGKSSFLADFARSEPQFLVIHVLDRDGQGSVLQPPDQLELAITSDLKRGFNAAQRGESFLSDAIRTEMFPEGGIVIALPVISSEREIVGVVEAFVSLSPIKARLDVEKKREVVAYVVDRRGNLVLSTEPRTLGESMAKVELVSEFIAHPLRSTRSYVRGEGVNAHRVLGTIAPVDSPDWGVIVEKDEALAYGSVAQMTRASTRGAALALFLAAIVAFLAARALSRPVVELADKARLIAEGNLSQRVKVRGTRELAELSQTFNHMTESLERSMEKLKLAAKENQELFINSIRTLAAAIDAKDPYTRGHSERVARYAVVLARHYGMTPEEIRKVRIAALLHDVGKIGIDDRILRKPTALTDEEFEVMKTHPTKGALIMGQIPQLRDVVPGIKYHHEKWEGGGYPDGLVREEIPLLARIVTVADTFDAMTTTRPYQKAMALEYVVARIQSFSGTRFDPAVVVALEKAFSTRDLEVVGEAARMAVSA